MEISLLLAEQIAALLLMGLAGFALVRMRFLSAEDSRVCSILLLYIVYPCSFIDAFQVPFHSEKLVGIALGALAAALFHLCIIPCVSLLRKPFKLDVVDCSSAVYSNSGNLIFPVVTAVLGPEYVLYVSGYIVVQTTLFWTHLISRMNRNFIFDWRRIFSQINILAIITGLLFFVTNISLPKILHTVVHGFAVTIGPLSFLVAGLLLGGMTLHFSAFRRALLPIGLRLLLCPLIGLPIYLFLALFFPEGRAALFISFLAACAPSASTVVQMAQLFDHDSIHAAVIHIASTVLCVISMPLLVALFQFFLSQG